MIVRLSVFSLLDIWKKCDTVWTLSVLLSICDRSEALFSQCFRGSSRLLRCPCRGAALEMELVVAKKPIDSGNSQIGLYANG